MRKSAINKAKTAARPSATGQETTAAAAPKVNKLDLMASLLRRDGGASIGEMQEATGWLKHSIRGAMAGALKKRGLVITSHKLDGERRYHAAAA